MQKPCLFDPGFERREKSTNFFARPFQAVCFEVSAITLRYHKLNLLAIVKKNLTRPGLSFWLNNEDVRQKYRSPPQPRSQPRARRPPGAP